MKEQVESIRNSGGLEVDVGERLARVEARLESMEKYLHERVEAVERKLEELLAQRKPNGKLMWVLISTVGALASAILVLLKMMP